MGDGKPGPLARFRKFTTQDEPVLTAAGVVAAALYVISRFVPGLTDDDLQLIALVLLPFAPAILARFRAWSPTSVEREVTKAYDDGVRDGRATR